MTCSTAGWRWARLSGGDSVSVLHILLVVVVILLIVWLLSSVL
jgi:hypothetical protein